MTYQEALFETDSLLVLILDKMNPTNLPQISERYQDLEDILQDISWSTKDYYLEFVSINNKSIDWFFSDRVNNFFDGGFLKETDIDNFFNSKVWNDKIKCKIIT